MQNRVQRIFEGGTLRLRKTKGRAISDPALVLRNVNSELLLEFSPHACKAHQSRTERSVVAASGTVKGRMRR